MTLYLDASLDGVHWKEVWTSNFSPAASTETTFRSVRESDLSPAVHGCKVRVRYKASAPLFVELWATARGRGAERSAVPGARGLGRRRAAPVSCSGGADQRVSDAPKARGVARAAPVIAWNRIDSKIEPIGPHDLGSARAIDSPSCTCSEETVTNLLACADRSFEAAQAAASAEVLRRHPGGWIGVGTTPREGETPGWSTFDAYNSTWLNAFHAEFERRCPSVTRARRDAIADLALRHCARLRRSPEECASLGACADRCVDGSTSPSRDCDASLYLRVNVPFWGPVPAGWRERLRELRLCDCHASFAPGALGVFIGPAAAGRFAGYFRLARAPLCPPGQCLIDLVLSGDDIDALEDERRRAESITSGVFRDIVSATPAQRAAWNERFWLEFWSAIRRDHRTLDDFEDRDLMELLQRTASPTDGRFGYNPWSSTPGVYDPAGMEAPLRRCGPC